MKLDHVQLNHFRNLASVDIRPSRSLNVIWGRNGSGKSSLLEALHYLGFGRSFRTSKHHHVVSHGEEQFTVFGEATQGDDAFRLGYQRYIKGETQIRCNGESLQRVSDLVRYLPIQLFTPQSGDVITGGPSGRRRFLDWGLFHVEQQFHDVSVRYAQALRQRNALLKSHKRQLQNIREAEMDAYWCQALVQYGEQLDAYRQAFVGALKPYLDANLGQFLTEFSFKISYHSGWEKGLSLRESMEKQRERDQLYGFTHSGPHKADLQIRIEGSPAAEVISRGQCRMLMAAMLLAESQLLLDKKQRHSIFLLDDIGAELDSTMRERFISRLMEMDAQLFVTAIESQQVAFTHHYNEKKTFHVEHGQVKEE